MAKTLREQISSLLDLLKRGLLTKKTDVIKLREEFYGKPDSNGKICQGIKLLELKNLLEHYNLTVKASIADRNISSEQLRNEMIKSLCNSESFVIANFDVGKIG